VLGLPRGFVVISRKVWVAFFGVCGATVWCTALTYVRVIAEAAYASVKLSAQIPQNIHLLFRLATGYMIAAFTTSSIAVIITDEIRLQGILFAAITVLHFWLTPYMMRVIIILYIKVCEHLRALRAQFATRPLSIMAQKEGEKSECDSKEFQIDENKQDAASTALANNSSKESYDKNNKNDGIELGSSNASTMMTTNPIANNPERLMQQQQQQPQQRRNSPRIEDTAAAASSTADSTLSRLPMITAAKIKDEGTYSSYKSSRSKIVMTFKRRRAHELGKLEAVVRKLQITLCVWTILGILAPILSGINAFALIRSSKRQSDSRNEAYQDNVWNPIVTATILGILLFNGLVLWNFGGPWSLARCTQNANI